MKRLNTCTIGNKATYEQVKGRIKLNINFDKSQKDLSKVLNLRCSIDVIDIIYEIHCHATIR